MKNKIIIKGILELETPLLLGSGDSNNTDVDVLLDKNKKPFIPATSFMGVLRHIIKNNYDISKNIMDIFFGKDVKSKISCDDLNFLSKDVKDIKDVRDGIRIDNKTGITKDKGKFNYETVNKGLTFSLRLEIDYDNDENEKKFVQTVINQLNLGFYLGAKTNLGLGKVKIKDLNISNYDLTKKEHIKSWLYDKDLNNITNGKFFSEMFKLKNDNFVINAIFEIKNSLIIKSYSKNANESDSAHLKSGKDNILSGSSIKGSLRARIERILNTLFDNEFENLQIIDSFLGGIEKDNKGEELKSKKAYKTPSRFLVEEVNISDVVDNETQARIKIDRFTGGTIESALFDSMPLFSKGSENIKNFKITIKKANSFEKGLALLVLKDLWTADLPIGGEKNVGRGVLIGKNAEVYDQNKEKISFKNISDLTEEQKKLLQSYVDDLQKYDEIKNIAEKRLKEFRG